MRVTIGINKTAFATTTIIEISGTTTPHKAPTIAPTTNETPKNTGLNGELTLQKPPFLKLIILAILMIGLSTLAATVISLLFENVLPSTNDSLLQKKSMDFKVPNVLQKEKVP